MKSISIRAAGGGMVDADPEIKKEIDNETSRLNKMFGGGDLTQFPDIKFEGKWNV